MGQSIAKATPEEQYDWTLSCRKLYVNEKKNIDALLLNYGRAVNSKQEAPLFEDEPTMCRCCPKADHIFLPNFTSTTARSKLSMLESIVKQKESPSTENKKKEFIEAFQKWKNTTELKNHEELEKLIINTTTNDDTDYDEAWNTKAILCTDRQCEKLICKEGNTSNNPGIVTGLVYDERMVEHEDIPGCEIGERIVRIYGELKKQNLISKCVDVPAREATTDELLRVHTKKHIDAIDKLKHMTDRDILKFENKLNSIKLNQETPLAARLAAGGLIDLCKKVSLTKEIDNGFAIIRPPGHHCESCLPFGFCLYSNVAIAIRALHEEKPDMKVLVVDWDVHHGNSTQHQFWHDDRVLYFSTHRFDNGHMFPGTGCGDLDRIGADAGEGYNCNIPFSDYDDTVGDREYMYAWERVLIPMAKAFQPDLIIVSCGFDSARGDPLGGFDLTPNCYGHMTRILQNLSKDGNVVLALEGGYNLESISLSGAMCVRALLGEDLDDLDLNGMVDTTCVKIIDDCRSIHNRYLLQNEMDDKDVSYLIKKNIAEEDDLKEEEVEKIGLEEKSLEGKNGDDDNNNNNNNEDKSIKKESSLPNDDDGGLNMLGYQIQPLRKCKHTETAHQNPVIDDVNDILKCSVDGCEFGDVAMESNMLTNMWICVTTLKPFCGRCLNACGIKHAQETGNCVLIGYDDLSLWCYGESDGCKGCDNYVDPFAIEKIRPVFACVHKLKFGSEPNFPTITSTNRDDDDDNNMVDDLSQGFSLTLEIIGGGDDNVNNNENDGVVESKK